VVDRASGWIDKMVSVGLRPNTVSYNAVLKTCSKAGDVAAARLWLDRMLSKSVKPDVISWNSAIAACASAHPRAGPEAEKMFRELVASGLVPDGILLTTLARAV
ncbi:unnamed protein product, partial [Polarella glacialis]